MIQPIIISPHLDDAALSAFSVLNVDNRESISVVNVFTGKPSITAVTEVDAVTGAMSSQRLMELRLEEDAEALSGAKTYHLDLLDNQYRSINLRNYEIADDVEQELTEKIAYGLERLQISLADYSDIFIPRGIGGHPDHLIVRNAVLSLCKQHLHGKIRFYADMPYAIRYGWPNWILGTEKDPFLDVDAFWKMSTNKSNLDFENYFKIISFSAEDIKKKREMIKKYKTQYSSLTCGTIDIFKEDRNLQYEVHWSLESCEGYQGIISAAAA